VTFLGVPQWILLCYLFIVGSVVGSFLNVCIYRMPLHDRLGDQLRGLLSPPSRCPRCGKRLLLRDNLPIVGWIFRRGRCRYCQGRIALRYPLIEAFTGALFVLVYWMEVPAGFGASLQESCVYAAIGPQGVVGSQWHSDAAIANWRYVYHMVLVVALVVATFIDIDLKIIPDGSTLPAMAIGILGGWGLGYVYLVPVWFQDPGILRSLEILGPEWLPSFANLPRHPAWIDDYPHLHGLAVSLAGLIVGGGMVWGVRLMGYWVLRQEAMGFGDVILMGMIGSFLGWQPTVLVFFLAPLCALVVLAGSWIFRRQREIPYGPYLSLAALLVILGWKRIWPAAERVFELGPLLPIAGVLTAGAFVLCLQLIQGVKRLLGIAPGGDEWIEEWTSADQLTYQAGENVDPASRGWERSEWPGVSSGRGLVHEHRWRNGG